MEVQVSEIEDFENWLNLAKEVEPLFGPMSGEELFQVGLKDLIIKEQAFCIKKGNDFCGAIAISKDENEILWFAVSERFKNRGYGKLLLKFAMKNLDNTRNIIVQTFSEGIDAGEPARKLYKSLGFVDLKPSETNPAGYPTVIMVKS